MNASKHWPFAAALVLFAVQFGAIFSSAVGFTRGELVYGLDDSYIHMAIARSLASHGVWGIDGVHFAGASSSLLWPSLLAILFLLQGANDFAPLVLNVLAVAALLAAAHAWLVRRGVSSPVIFLVLCAVIVSTPLAPLSMTGLEHVLHACFAVAFAAVWSETYAAPDDRRWPPIVVTAAFLLGAVRYEGLFEAGLAALALFACRRRRLAMLILGAALLPAAVYAVVSLAAGWHALPNSVLLKGARPAAYSPLVLFFYFLGRLKLLWSNTAALVPLVAVGAVLAMGRRLKPGAGALAWLFVGTALAHIALGSYGWLFRYEAYLVAFGLVSLGGLAASVPGASAPQFARWPAVLVVLGLCAYPLVERAIDSHRMSPLASKNISDQQVQMARFLAAYYPGRSVAANDIGAIGYYGGVKLLDLFGLSDLEVADSKLKAAYDTGTIKRIAAEHGVEVAVVYNGWFPGGIPPEWIEVARWKITPWIVVASDTVSFYATSATGAAGLLAALKEFQPKLPSDVEVKYRSRELAPSDHDSALRRALPTEEGVPAHSQRESVARPAGLVSGFATDTRQGVRE
jgi:hypothetical protein